MSTEVRVGPKVGAGNGTEVETKGTLIAGTPAKSPVTKIIVAVHGVGDQYSYATIQSVVNQFCGFYRQPAAIALQLPQWQAGVLPSPD